MIKRNMLIRRVVFPAITGVILGISSAAMGGTITVVSFGQNGPSDRMDSGTTPKTLFTGSGGGVLPGDSTDSQFSEDVSRLDFNVQHESLQVFIATNAGEGATGDTTVGGGELSEVTGNQVYVTDVIASGDNSFGTPPKDDYTPSAGFVEHRVGSGFDSIAPGQYSSASSIFKTPIPPTQSVPEPASLAMMATLGLAILGVRRKKSK